MPLIKPRTGDQHQVRLISKLFRKNNETLYAYAAFLNEDPEYVLNQFVATKPAKDKEFLRWRASHPESYVPRRTPHGHRSIVAPVSTARASRRCVRRRRLTRGGRVRWGLRCCEQSSKHASCWRCSSPPSAALGDCISTPCVQTMVPGADSASESHCV